MIGAQMIYGALGAKTKALYGKRLRFADYEALVALPDERAMLDYLSQHPGWSKVVAQLRDNRNGQLNRVELERVLRDQVRAHYLSLAHFIPKEDKSLMTYLSKLAEKDAILTALHRLKAGQYYLGNPTSSRYVLKGQIDEKKLEQCTSYAQLVEATQGSIYYDILKGLTLQHDGLPDYTVADGLLQSAYFGYMYRVIRRDYRGGVQKTLLQSLGFRVDLLNLIHVLRLKTYAPDAPQEVYLSVLFPYHHRLKPTLLVKMCQAPDVATIFDLLQETSYRNTFTQDHVAHVEEHYRETFYHFNKRQLVGGTPSIYTALSYLYLKESELQALINVVESVKYGVPYNKEFAKLVGS